MLKTYNFEDKEIGLALNKAEQELNCSSNEMVIIKNEIDGGLFKSPKVELNILKHDDLKIFIKDYFDQMSKYMDIDIVPEIKIRENVIKINLVTSNNPVMIGNRGRTLKAMRLLLKQTLNLQVEFKLIVNIDIANYNETQRGAFEREIKRIAIGVLMSKIDADLDPMNSYQRRIVHKIISEYDELETVSTGIGTERHVIIKYKER